MTANKQHYIYKEKSQSGKISNAVIFYTNIQNSEQL